MVTQVKGSVSQDVIRVGSVAGLAGISDPQEDWQALASGVPFEYNSGSWGTSLGFVTPKAYGANGDGVSDDSMPVQAAIDSGNPVFLDALYACSNLSITNNVILFSNGAGGLKLLSGADSRLIESTTNNSTFTMRNMIIDGNSDNQTPQMGQSCVRIEQDGAIDSSVRHVFDGVAFKNPSKHGVYALCNNTGNRVLVSIDGCTFGGGELQDSAYGVEYVSFSGLIHAEVNGATMDYGSSVSAPDSPPTGISFSTQGVVPANQKGSITISDSYFRRVGRDQSNGLGAVSLYASCNYVNINNLTFEDCYGQALEVKTHSKNINISNISIDTVFGNNSTPSGFALEGSNVDDGAGNFFVDQNFTLSNITINDVRGGGVSALIESGGIGVSTKLFDNLHISNVIVTQGSGDGISFKNLKDLSLKGFSVDCSGVGLRLQTCDGVAFVSDGKVSTDGDTAIQCSSPDLFLRMHDSEFFTTANRAGELQSLEGMDVHDCLFDGGVLSDARIGGYTLSSRFHNNKAETVVTIGDVSKLDMHHNITGSSSPYELTISGNNVTVFDSAHTLDTEGDASTDDLDTINNGYLGRVVSFRTADSGRDVTLRHGVGNLQLPGAANITLSDARDTISLWFDGANWRPFSS